MLQAGLLPIARTCPRRRHHAPNRCRECTMNLVSSPAGAAASTMVLLESTYKRRDSCDQRIRVPVDGAAAGAVYDGAEASDCAAAAGRDC